MAATFGENADFSPALIKRLMELIALGQSRPAEAIPLIRRFFNEEGASIWPVIGRVTLEAERAIASLAADGSPVLIEAFVRQTQAQAEELGGHDAEPLLKALAENVALNGLAAAEADRTAVKNIEASAPRLAALELRRAAAHRRYQHALRSLATAKKLLQVTMPHPITIAEKMQRHRRPVAAAVSPRGRTLHTEDVTKN
jgi:hypothetical protein